MQFGGSWAALPTPFRAGGIDYLALRGLVRRQIAGGTRGLVVNGTTGEAATLSLDERLATIATVVGLARDVPVVAGIGGSDTRATCELARLAAGMGVAGVLVVTPPYNRPGQRGLLAHFRAVAEASELPLVLYNVPKRTGTDLLPATAAELARDCASIVAIKEAGGSIERVAVLAQESELTVLWGDDARVVDAILAGARGVVGVAANVRPGAVSRLVDAALEGAEREARAIEESLAPLIELLAADTNPAPLKAALEIEGWAAGDLRLPLVTVEADLRRSLVATLAGLPDRCPA